MAVEKSTHFSENDFEIVYKKKFNLFEYIFIYVFFSIVIIVIIHRITREIFLSIGDGDVFLLILAAWPLFLLAGRKTQTCRFDKKTGTAEGIVNRIYWFPLAFRFRFPEVVEVAARNSLGGEGADDYYVEIRLNTGNRIRLNWLKDDQEAETWAERIREMLRNAPDVNPYL